MVIGQWKALFEHQLPKKILQDLSRLSVRSTPEYPKLEWEDRPCSKSGTK